jgi:hypothetical protein
MKKQRLTYKTLAEIEKALSSLPHPLRVEREGKGPVKMVDDEGELHPANLIQSTPYPSSLHSKKLPALEQISPCGLYQNLQICSL